MSTQQSKYASKLTGKNVLVFGGTSGIGFCVAEACVEFGAKVTISSSNSDKIAKAIDKIKASYPDISSANLRGIRCDLSDLKTMEDNVVEALKFAAKDGPIHHIATTAGDSFKPVTVFEVSAEHIAKMGRVRQTAPMMIAKHIREYAAPGPGSSFTITGGLMSHKPSPGWFIQATGASGNEGLARGLAVDLKPIRVNLVAPGAIHTELFNSVGEERLPQLIEMFRSKTLTGEIGRPEDTAEAYVYCMKDRFVTGSIINTNGGALLV